MSPSSPSGMLATLMREHRWLTAVLLEYLPWDRREPRCEAIRRDCGVRCREVALPEVPVCWMHDDGDWKATSFQSGKQVKVAVDTYVRRSRL
jgi:hypothetical protein